MCGRFTLEPTARFYERFGITDRLPDLAPRYNIAPGQTVPVIAAERPHELTLMHWGLIPHWAKEQTTKFKMINARVEMLTGKPAYRGLLTHNRCLVPVSGFYEWKAGGKGKSPYYIHPAHDPFIAFAGLYDVWTRPDGEPLYSFTIITTEAQGAVAQLHNRMPVMLDPSLESAWLDTERTNPRELLSEVLNRAYQDLETYPVSRSVNKPSVDDPSLVQPAGEKSGE
jgi:putative SOS response-associated peptidase YedK